jgi:CubicO group peptidase (beta-lactamase class C family)
VLKRLGQLLGLFFLLGFIYLNIDYWSDPMYWRRWWDIVTHMSPDHMNFSPTASVKSRDIYELPVADVRDLTIAPDALRTAEEFAAGLDSFGFIVVHRGVVQTEWYGPGWNRDRLTQSQSMNKTVTAMMMGIAIEDGFVESVHDPIGKYLVEWQGDPRGDITIENLLFMSSGLAQYRFSLNPFAKDTAFRFLNSQDRAVVVLNTALEWPPGSKFDYNDINAQLTGMIVERASGTPYAEYLQERLWDPMGGQFAELWLDDEGGLAMMACCLLASAVDWAKIGLMMKNGGSIEGRQVVPAEWIGLMIEPSPLYSGYGYLTWLGQGLMDEGPGKEGIERNQAEPFLAPDMFYLSGYGGQRVYVDRDNDLIVVRLGPFSGMQPLKPHWDNAFLLNTIIRGIRQ